MHDCPQCNAILESIDEVCPKCSFDFNTTLSCPYLISKRCVHTNKVCSIIGLNYELCSIYLHKAAIKF